MVIKMAYLQSTDYGLDPRLSTTHNHIPIPNRKYQEFRREGWTETAIILCKLNKSL